MSVAVTEIVALMLVLCPVKTGDRCQIQEISLPPLASVELCEKIGGERSSKLTSPGLAARHLCVPKEYAHPVALSGH